MDTIQVAIPTYNRELYLSKLISSVPSYINIYISDNGSFVTQQFKDKFSNCSFISHPEVIGIFNNWNSAAISTTSEWIIIPSDDDIFFDGAFDTITTYINKYPDADIIIFGHKIIDDNDALSQGWMPFKEEVFEPPMGYEKFKYGVEARMPCMVFKNDFIKKLGYFDTYFKLTASDSDLVQRSLLQGKSVFVPKIIGAYRVWKGNLTSQKVATKLWLDEIDYWQQKIATLNTQQHLNVNIRTTPFNIADEVFARNLLYGVRSIRKSKGFSKAFKFLTSVRFPYKAKIKTQLRIIKSLF